MVMMVVVMMMMMMMVMVMVIMVVVVVMVMVMMMILSHYHRLLFTGRFVNGALVLSAQNLLGIGNGIQQLGK